MKVGACAWVCMHMERPGDDVACPPRLPSNFIFRDRVSPWTQSSLIWSRWLAKELQESFGLFLAQPQCWGCRCTPLLLAFYVGAGTLNPRPHACMASVFTKQAIFSTPPFLYIYNVNTTYIKQFWHICMHMCTQHHICAHIHYIGAISWERQRALLCLLDCNSFMIRSWWLSCMRILSAFHSHIPSML